MTRSTPYNGWKNWATWNVALWLGNDEGLYRAAREEVDRLRKHDHPLNARRARIIVRNLMPEGTPDMTPRPNRAYSGVDFAAIAEMLGEV